MSDRTVPSVWAYKPWWCQPWSIVLTGTGLIAGSWLLFHRYWMTGVVALPVMVWMGFFLLVWPRLMREAGGLTAESASTEFSEPGDTAS